MTPTKFGLRLAAIHTVLVVCAFVWSIAAGYRLAGPVWVLLYSLDLPAPFLLLQFDTFPLPDSYPWYKFTQFILLFGTIGGAWWFGIGWIVGLCRRRMDARGTGPRFMAALTTVLIIVVVVWGVQFFLTIPNIAHDGCASAGIPVPFFRGCYGTLSWYWPAMSVSGGALLLDAVAWVFSALLMSLCRGRRLKGTPACLCR